MVPSPRTAIVADGLAKLTQAFKNQPNCKAILAEFLKPFQEIENVFWDIINGRILDNIAAKIAIGTPVGDQLDVIGGLVGEPRAGRTDSIYFPSILLRIRVNRSQGTAEDVIQVANLIAPGSTYAEAYPAKFVVEAINLAPGVAATMATMLSKTREGGTRGTLHYTTWDPVLSQANLIPGSLSGAVTGSMAFGTLTPALTVPQQPINVGVFCACEEA